MRRLIWVLAWIAWPGLAFAQTPRMLIGQLQVLDEAGHDIAVPVALALAQELDAGGRVDPAAWVAEDPRFHAWAREAHWRPSAAPGTLEDALAGGRRLNAPFVAFLSAARHQGRLIGQVQVFRDGREVWRDSKSMEARVGGDAAWATMGETLARTWAQLMGQGPLERLARRPRIDTPRPEPGKEADPPIRPTEPPPATPDALLEARRLLRQNLRTEAVLKLRAAIDARPFDLELRAASAQLMFDMGLSREAALEARRTAGMAPERSDLRLLAARAWLQAGSPDEARADLNEALARGADPPSAHLIQGEIFAQMGRFRDALEAFGRAREGGEAFEGRLGLAYAQAMLGDMEASRANLLAATPTSAAAHAMAFRRWMARLDVEATRQIEELREIQRLGRTGRIDAALRERASQAQVACAGAAAFVADFPAIELHRGSTARRALAHRLLAQAAAETAAFTQGDLEAGAECALTLAEAAKQFGQTRQQWDQEAASAP